SVAVDRLLLAGFGETNGAFIADRQLPPAFGAPTRQNRLAILSLHTRAEAVRLGATAVVRLERSLRHCISCGCSGELETLERYVGTNVPEPTFSIGLGWVCRRFPVF